LSCHRLISSWKTDLNVSLAALELLSGLARMHIKDSGEKSCEKSENFEIKTNSNCASSSEENWYLPFDCSTFHFDAI
jgi:hypothetical protein